MATSRTGPIAGRRRRRNRRDPGQGLASMATGPLKSHVMCDELDAPVPPSRMIRLWVSPAVNDLLTLTLCGMALLKSRSAGAVVSRAMIRVVREALPVNVPWHESVTG